MSHASTSWHGVALLVVLTVANPPAATAQVGLPLRGHVSRAGEVLVFQPCGAVEPWTLAVSGEIGDEIGRAVDFFGGGERRRSFVALEGWIDSGPIPRAASGFAGSWTPTRVETVRSEESTDCDGEPTPLWLRSGCDALAPPDLDCLPAELVRADLRLARYVMEAVGRMDRAREVTASQAAWKRTREIRCAATRPGGSVDPLWVLSCRLGMSRARLLVIWDEYLSGAGTELPHPRAGIQS